MMRFEEYIGCYVEICRYMAGFGGKQDVGYPVVNLALVGRGALSVVSQK